MSYTAVFLGFVKCQERREDGKVTTTLLVDGGPLGGTLQRFHEDKAQRVTDSVFQIIGTLWYFNEIYWIVMASLKSFWTSTNTSVCRILQRLRNVFHSQVNQVNREYQKLPAYFVWSNSLVRRFPSVSAWCEVFQSASHRSVERTWSRHCDLRWMLSRLLSGLQLGLGGLKSERREGYRLPQGGMSLLHDSNKYIPILYSALINLPTDLLLSMFFCQVHFQHDFPTCCEFSGAEGNVSVQCHLELKAGLGWDQLAHRR